MRTRLLLPLAVVACNLGPRPKSFVPAQSPAGVTARLETARHVKYAGEVVAVLDTALVFREGEGLYLIPFAAIRTGRFHQLSDFIEDGRFTDGPRGLARVRLVSRFPQGLAPDQLRALLAAYGQETLRRIDR